jgi:addiction module HigA family antidote
MIATKRLRPVHPGDILAHDFMEPLKLSSYKLAKEISVSVPTVNEIVCRRRAITAEMALRLSRYFGTTAQLWQNLQSQYDLEIASQKIGKTIARVIQPLARPDLAEHPV